MEKITLVLFGDGKPQDINPIWRITPMLTVHHAALLLANIDPDSDIGRAVPGTDQTVWPKGYMPALQLVSSLLLVGEITGMLTAVEVVGNNGMATGVEVNTCDPFKSMVHQTSLKTWLAAHGIDSGFYFPSGFNGPDYLNPDHPRYSKRIASILTAWKALTDCNGRSPKNAAVEWLTAHAQELDLLHTSGQKKGEVKKDAIEEMARAINWEPDGGAPTTPSQKA